MAKETCPLERARIEAGLTLRQFAERVGRTATTVMRWERGTRRLKNHDARARVALVLGTATLQAYDVWFAKLRLAVPPFSFTTDLPDGMSREEAKRRCLAAIGVLAGEQAP